MTADRFPGAFWAWALGHSKEAGSQHICADLSCMGSAYMAGRASREATWQDLEERSAEMLVEALNALAAVERERDTLRAALEKMS